MELLTRTVAVQQNLNKYFTGKPCKYGHIAPRLVSNRACLPCCVNHSKATEKPKKQKYDRTFYDRYYPSHIGEITARTNLRRARLLRATPPWFEKKEVEQLYVQARKLTMATGISHHVDHIVPLQNPNVCGLHCLANLQIVTEQENKSKSNKF